MIDKDAYSYMIERFLAYKYRQENGILYSFDLSLPEKLVTDYFDMKKALEKFSMEECKTADLYPNIWDDEEDIDEIKEEIMDCFQCMKEFYHHILEANGNVLIMIC